MSPNLIAAIASVIVIIITVIGQWISSRNDRNLTNQELDILKRLDPSGPTARELSEVIQFRVAKWRRRIAKSRQRLRSGSAWFVAGYLIYVFLVVPLSQEEGKDADLTVFFWALIVFGGVAFLIAAVRLVQFVVARSEEVSRRLASPRNSRS
jgi:hypothetical protein